MAKRLIWILSILLVLPACVLGASLALAGQLETSDDQLMTSAAPPAGGASVEGLLDTRADPIPEASAGGCPSTFCTSNQKTQCFVNTCHGHGIGLVCDYSNCTSQCICGSVPPGGAPPESLSPVPPVDPLQEVSAGSCPSSFCSAEQKRQCSVRCHGKGIGLVCDFSNCTSQCICGSVPPG